MNNQKNSSTQRFEFNLQNDLTYEECSKLATDKQDKNIFDYHTMNFHDSECEAPKVAELSYGQPTIYIKDGYGFSAMNGCNIDKDTDLKMNEHKLTNLNTIQQLKTRTHLTTRSTAKGHHDVDQESKFFYGGYSFPDNRQLSNKKIREHKYTPLIGKMKQFVNDNLAAEFKGVRGGAPSRVTTKNSNYNQKCK